MKKNTTKRALFASILAIALCCTMLIGTTYAWFTDSVSSAGNIIKSGTLNIDLLVKGGDTGYTDYTSVKTSSAPVFNYDKWEPGYTSWANAKVTTTGNLALKYTMKIVADGTVSALAEVIDVYYAASEVAQPATRPADLAAAGLTKIGTLKDALDGVVVINDTLIPGSNEEDLATIVLHMQESAGNEYQNLEIGASFAFQILATQYTNELDSFDDQYDADAPLPFTAVASTAELTAAAAQGGNVVVNADVNAPAGVVIVEDTTINGNGNTISGGTGSNKVLAVSSVSGKTVTVNDVTLDATTSSTKDYQRGISLYGNTDVEVDINGSTIKAGWYAINVAGANNGVEINVEDSALEGWSAINVWSKSDITVKNSTLTGTNDKTYNADGWNNFSTIVMNYDGTNSTNGSVLTFEGCTIKSITTTGNQQGWIDFRDDNITATFTNCTFIVEGTPADQLITICEHEVVTFTNCTFIVNGVELTTEQAQALVLTYSGNDATTNTVTFN